MAASPAQRPRSRARNQGGDWEKRALVVFAGFFFLVLVLVAAFDTMPTRTSWHIYNCILALAAAGIAALLPGTLDLNWRTGVRATGALAMAVLVFYAGRELAPAPPQMQDIRSYLVFPSTEGDPRNSDVYVVLNAKVVKSDVVSSSDSSFSVADQPRGNQIQIVRGPGGIRVDFTSLRHGDEFYVMVQENSKWWVSSDITVPDAQLEMKPTSMGNLSNRVKSGR
jgi:hypothetical protein